MIAYWYIFVILAAAAFGWRKDLRREMIWAGLIALPVLFVEPLVSRSFSPFTAGAVWVLLTRALLVFSLGVVASVLYEVFLKKTLSPQRHPHRPHLVWLLSGLVVTVGLMLGWHQTFMMALMAGLAIDILVVLVWRRDLFWDAVVSGTGMALLYILIFYASTQLSTSHAASLLFSDNSLGIALWSVPVEELLVIALFGALWGPLYIAVKHYDQTPGVQFFPHALYPKMVLTVLVLVGLIGGTVWAANEVAVTPSVVSVDPLSKLGPVSLTDPVAIHFNRPVDRNRLAFAFTPDINGQWTFTNPDLGQHAYRTAVFTPDPAWPPATSYQLNLGHISSLLGVGQRSWAYSFTTKSLPLVATSSLNLGQPVDPCGTWTVTLDSQNNQIAEFHWLLNPSADVTAVLTADRQTYNVKPVGCLQPATIYTLTLERIAIVHDPTSQDVVRTAEPKVIWTKKFTTSGQPIPAPAPTASTPPPAPPILSIRAVAPSPGSTGIGAASAIRVNFNQPVQTDAAETKLTIQPLMSGAYSWDGQVMIFKPTSPLAPDQDYRVTVAAGVLSATGETLAADYSWSFHTALSTIILNIAEDYQDKPLSCEAAALKMALAGKGVMVTEDDIMNSIGYDPTPHEGDIWGDPDVAYVGNINGRQNTTGYGVHWGPTARAASHWRPAEAFSGWTAAQVANEIAKGNPVVIWGTIGRAYYDPWHTPTGKLVKAWKGEHTRMVIGYTGSTANPKSFIINDPYVGRMTWSTATLNANWSAFGNSGVVVR